jgi:hypothetical protein
MALKNAKKVLRYFISLRKSDISCSLRIKFDPRLSAAITMACSRMKTSAVSSAESEMEEVGDMAESRPEASRDGGGGGRLLMAETTQL